MTILHRYWFTFLSLRPLDPLRLGCGVTAYGVDDAINILRQTVFVGRGDIKIDSMIADVDITTLDQGHVVPNMDVPVWRGIWFPKGYPLPIV